MTAGGKLFQLFTTLTENMLQQIQETARGFTSLHGLGSISLIELSLPEAQIKIIY